MNCTLGGVIGYVGGTVMERSQRPPKYGEAVSRGPFSTASHWKRSSSFEGPRCRTASLGVDWRSCSSCVRRLRALPEEDLLERGVDDILTILPRNLVSKNLQARLVRLLRTKCKVRCVDGVCLLSGQPQPDVSSSSQASPAEDMPVRLLAPPELDRGEATH